MAVVAAVNNIICCGVSKAVTLLEQSRKGCLTTDLLYKNALTQFQVQSAASYVPVGQQLTAGFFSATQIDLSGITVVFPSNLVLSIVIDGTQIAVVPDTTFANVGALVTAIVAEINGSGAPYSATDLGSNVIEVEATTPSASINGFQVDIIVNPTVFVTENAFAGVSLGNCIVVNDINSTFYGRMFVGTQDSGTSYIKVFENGANTSDITVPFNTVGFPFTLLSSVLVFSESLNRIYVTGEAQGRYSYIDSSFTVYSNPSYTPPTVPFSNEPFTPSTPIGTGTNAYTRGVYNTTNNSVYLSSPNATVTNDTVRCINSSGTMSILSGVAMSNPQEMAVNPNTGDLWICGQEDIYIFDNTNTYVTTIVGSANINPLGITYCDSTNRMYIVFRDSVTQANSFVATYNGTTYAIDNPSFYTININATSGAVFYSTAFNLLFINSFTGTDLYCDLVRLDGSLMQQVLLDSKLNNYSYQDDIKYGKVIGTSSDTTGETPLVVRVFELGNEGEEEFSGILTGGVAPTYTDGSTNCLDEDDYESLEQKLNEECNACCGGVSTTPQTTVTPSSGTWVIYFGNDLNVPSVAGDITSLGSVSLSSYVSTYGFVATSPSEYKVIAIPAALGTPSRFYDVNTTLDVAMQSVFQITVNSIVYNIFVTFNQLGGAITIGIQS